MAADNLVNRLPKYDFIKNERINKTPANISDKLTKEASVGEKLKYLINFCGGSGNLLNPWIIKAIPKNNLKIN